MERSRGSSACLAALSCLGLAGTGCVWNGRMPLVNVMSAGRHWPMHCLPRVAIGCDWWRLTSPAEVSLPCPLAPTPALHTLLRSCSPYRAHTGPTVALRTLSRLTVPITPTRPSPAQLSLPWPTVFILDHNPSPSPQTVP